MSEEASAVAERVYWFSKNEVAGTLAMWAVRQSPYLVPANLNAAIYGMYEALPDDLAGMFSATEDQLQQIIELICMNDQTIASWNVPKSGHDQGMVFTSRYDRPSPNDDFIDLYALAGNICRSLLADQEAPSTLAEIATLNEGDGK